MARGEDGEVAPADLGSFFARADHALHPVHEGVGIAALVGDVDVLVAVGAAGDDGVLRVRVAW